MDYFFLLVTIVVSILILILAYIKRSIDLSALLSSSFVGTAILILIYLRNPRLWYWIYVVLAFFIFGNLVSKYKFNEKEKNGVEQDIRTFRNVFGNGGSAVIFSIFYYITNNELFLLGILGSMSTATADTFATEIGQIYEKNPRLITNLRKRVRVGTSGAVSLYGTIAAFIGAFLTSSIAIFFNKPVFLAIGIVSGIIGCNMDSIFGAIFERDIIDKHMVNFFGTFSGGISAVLMGFIFKLV